VGRWPDPYTEATLAAGETEVCPPEAVAPGGGPFLRSLAASTETDPLALGRLSRVDLLDRLEPLDAAGGTPAPVDELGACLAGTWNWGALEPGDPCRGRRVALVRSGDLRLEGGEGQGVLAVAGSLELVGTRFRGLLLVEGDVRLDGGAEVEGVARVGGSLLIASGRWTSGPCAAYRALAAASPLRRPLLLPGAGWALF
jgi:hypothetical protein